MIVDQKLVGEVERLRKAAKEDDVVYELICLISKSILIDDLGNTEVIAEKEDLRHLEACQIASHFAEYDFDQSGSSEESAKV
ncbi:hypothetical protein SAMN05216302_101147 [Nitrosomonas aestuarii]|uniref:Uncharacterized protein n=1 Tax=Nitrosomonas aestuarii TaxID=52441 RepID=A0A1I4B5Q7_9PROT|nr:hypothetical protein [Nitrosomonas aestuarii]SFK64105.1 hypothetical protein SAMN05216302_101147 [Nitrosomonas aestuarii]